MRRSVKYGVYGAVLAAAVVGGTAAFATADDNGKSVTLVVDGKTSTIHTTASTVSSVLDGAGYDLSRARHRRPGGELGGRRTTRRSCSSAVACSG